MNYHYILLFCVLAGVVVMHVSTCEVSQCGQLAIIYLLIIDHYYLPQQLPHNGFRSRSANLALTVVLLALPSLTYGVTLHVRPTSTNISCPTHPCHTLAEYAQGPEQYFDDSNLTLQFLPGTHTLNVNLTITNIHQLEIQGAVLLTTLQKQRYEVHTKIGMISLFTLSIPKTV